MAGTSARVDCTRLHLQFHSAINYCSFSFNFSFVWLERRRTENTQKMLTMRRGEVKKPTHNIVKCIWRQQPLMEHEKYLFCYRHQYRHDYLHRQLAVAVIVFLSGIFFYRFTCCCFEFSPNSECFWCQDRTSTIWVLQEIHHFVDRTLWTSVLPFGWTKRTRTTRRVETSKLNKKNIIRNVSLLPQHCWQDASDAENRSEHGSWRCRLLVNVTIIITMNIHFSGW